MVVVTGAAAGSVVVMVTGTATGTVLCKLVVHVQVKFG